MLDILEFVFGSFWRFAGVALLLAILTCWTPITIKREHDD